MAESSELGQLIVKISTDVSELKAGMKKAKTEVDGFQKAAVGAFKVIAAAIAVEKIVAFGKSIVDLGDELNKLSQRTGMAASEIAQLRYVASQSDTSIESLTGSYKFLAKNMDEASNGNEKSIELFKRFHIEINNNDGTRRKLSDVFKDIADRVHNTSDQTTIYAAVQEMLGRGAQDLIPLLKQGSQEINRLSEAYKKLGASDEEINTFAKQADELKDAWDTVHKQFEIVGIKVMTALIPALTELAKWLIDQDWDKFAKFLKGTVENILFMTTGVIDLTTALINLWAVKEKKENKGILGDFTPEQLKQMRENGEQVMRYQEWEAGGKVGPRPKVGVAGYNGMPAGVTAQPGVTTTPERALDPFASGGTLNPLPPPAPGGGQGIDNQKSGGFNPFGGNFIDEMRKNLEIVTKEFESVNKQLSKIWEGTMEAISTGFGSAMADVIVDGKDFGEAMAELWKDIAKQVIQQIMAMVVKLMLLFVWQTLTGTTGSGGGVFGMFSGKGHRTGAVYAQKGMLHGAKGFATTGHMGEAGIPAVVHPGEIISPIDKFFDAVKQSGGNTFQITVNGNQDPQNLAQLLALEIERQRRSI